eukprot:5633292-Prymnesium_polylepis.1
MVTRVPPLKSPCEGPIREMRGVSSQPEAIDSLEDASTPSREKVKGVPSKKSTGSQIATFRWGNCLHSKPSKQSSSVPTRARVRGSVLHGALRSQSRAPQPRMRSMVLTCPDGSKSPKPENLVHVSVWPRMVST